MAKRSARSSKPEPRGTKRKKRPSVASAPARPEDIEKEFARLEPAELHRLQIQAELRARALSVRWPSVTGDDLLHEALLATYEERRAWNRKTPLVVHLSQAMRSIASNLYQRKEARVTIRDVPNAARHARTPDARLQALQQLDAIRALFRDDEIVSQIIDGRERDMTGPEIQASCGLSRAEYEAASKRLRRTLRRVYREGGLDV